MVKLLPENIGVPPVAAVYQFTVTPVTAVAVKVAVCPGQIVCALFATTGAVGMAFTVTITGVRSDASVQPVRLA